MVDIPDEHHDADENQHERDDDGDAGHHTLPFGLHLTQRQHCVRESADKNSNRELTGLVLQDALNDSWRELTHGELHDNHGDRQYERRETDHRRGDRTQDFDSSIRAATDRLWHELVVVRLVDRDRANGKTDAGKHTRERNEPESRRQARKGFSEAHGYFPAQYRSKLSAFNNALFMAQAASAPSAAATIANCTSRVASPTMSRPGLVFDFP